MEIIGIVALVLVVVLVAAVVVRGRTGASPADPNRGLPEHLRGGHGDTIDRPADAGAEGMAVPEPGDITTGPEEPGPR